MSSVKTTEFRVLIRLYVPIFLSLAFLTTGCSIYPGSTRHTDDLRKPDQLKKDVDYTYRKLNDFHGKLYWYIYEAIWKKELDSLKETITTPMTSEDFYMKFSPVIASLKQGHTQLFPLVSDDTYRKLRDYEKGKDSPLHDIGFEIFDDRLYITANKRNYPGIHTGTEVVRIGGLDPKELISDYKNTFASDGYNQTYATHRLGKKFASYFILRTGIADSIQCQLKFHDTIQDYFLTQINKISEDTIQTEKKPVLTKDDLPKQFRRAVQWKSGSLEFHDPDSTTAILKINDFAGRSFDYYLQYCFDLLRKTETQNLILDLRNNPGGSAKQAADLYSYLSPEPVPFLDEITVQRKTSLMHTPYYDGQSFSGVVMLTIFLPFRLIGLTGSYFAVKKNDDDTFYLKTHLSKTNLPVPNQFPGAVYVIINGGTFSAASLLSSNLKGSGRATFVGEETGGGWHGNSGIMIPDIILPITKLRVRLPLFKLVQYNHVPKDGRGINPDIFIPPTVEGVRQNIDRKMEIVKGMIRHSKEPGNYKQPNAK